MNTILTDDELPPLQPHDHPEPHSMRWSDAELRAIRARDRLVEAAVLAKLREQEPVAWLHPSNASCVTTDPTAYARGIPLVKYAAPLPAVVQVPKCKCGQPWILNTVHREHSPCWRAADPVDGIAAPEAPAQGDPLEKLTRIQEELGLYNDKPAQQARGERQSYRDDDDMPTEVAVLKREWKAMRLALSMPRTPTRVDLIQCLKCQQFWTGPVDAECPHCNPAQPSVPAPWREAMKVAREALEDARRFIVNGVEFGYIRMPDRETPDSAHDTEPNIAAALAQLDSLEGGE